MYVEVTNKEYSDKPPKKVEVKCSNCMGTGQSITETCPECNNRFLWHNMGSEMGRQKDGSMYCRNFTSRACKCGWEWRKYD